MNDTHLTTQDLRRLKSELLSLRFMQAAALTAGDLHEGKEAKAYMKELARLDKLLDLELKGRLS